MKNMIIHGVLSVLVLAPVVLCAQEATTPEYVTGTFAGTQVVNGQSVEVVPRRRSFGFMIQHRFGAVGPDEQAWKQFLGLDLPANIRFAFQYAPVQDAHLELGRSRNGKVWDLGLKTRLLKQTVEGEMPVSVSLFGNVALMSDDHPAVGGRDFFADGVTPFEYRFVHRISYNTQLIIARRFNRRLTLQLAPVAIYRNLVPIGAEHLTFTLVGAARYKVSTRGSLLLEAAPVLLGRAAGNHREPLALAYEVATAGHVFQIVIASSQEIIEQRVHTLPGSRYDKGYLHLGFNIARILFVKPPAHRERS
jgi:hypothetical protein